MLDGFLSPSGTLTGICTLFPNFSNSRVFSTRFASNYTFKIFSVSGPSTHGRGPSPLRRGFGKQWRAGGPAGSGYRFRGFMLNDRRHSYLRPARPPAAGTDVRVRA